jgi:hypothetical protein
MLTAACRLPFIILTDFCLDAQSWDLIRKDIDSKSILYHVMALIRVFKPLSCRISLTGRVLISSHSSPPTDLTPAY